LYEKFRSQGKSKGSAVRLSQYITGLSLKTGRPAKGDGIRKALAKRKKKS
jgi:hypothetical protein